MRFATCCGIAVSWSAGKPGCPNDASSVGPSTLPWSRECSRRFERLGAGAVSDDLAHLVQFQAIDREPLTQEAQQQVFRGDGAMAQPIGLLDRIPQGASNFSTEGHFAVQALSLGQLQTLTCKQLLGQVVSALRKSAREMPQLDRIALNGRSREKQGLSSRERENRSKRVSSPWVSVISNAMTRRKGIVTSPSQVPLFPTSRISGQRG